MVWERLLDVAVVEIDDRVPVWESLPANSIAEDHFLLSVQVCSLDLAVVADDLVLHLRVLCVLVVVRVWELHLVVFFVVVHVVGSLVLAITTWHLRRLILLVLLLIIDFGDVGKGVVIALQTILWIVAPGYQIRSAVVLLIFDLLLLVLELLDARLPVLGARPTLLLRA